MPGNGVYAVRPEKDDYQACITYIVDNPDLPFVLHVERDANVSDIMKSKGVERVRRLMIWRESQDIRDFEALTNLRSVNIGSSQAFDFSRLKLLEKVGGVWSKNWRGLEECKDLSVFHVSSFNKPDFRYLAGNPNVKRVGIIKSSVTSAEGLEVLAGLDDLDISYAPKFSDISTLRHCRQLTSFEMDGCRSMSNYDSLRDIDTLERLSLTKCAPMPSIEIIRSLVNLQYLGIFDTPILDKRLESCLDHPRLRKITLTGKGFSPSEEEVNRVLKARHSV